MWTVKEDVINDPTKIEEMEEILKEYANASQCSKGKQTTATSYSKKTNRVHVYEFQTNKVSFDTHMGYCLPSAIKLSSYIELDRFIILCNKDKIDYYTMVGQGWNPKKLIVTESIR